MILAFLGGQDERARDILRAVEERLVAGYINATIAGEVAYGYLRLATGLSSRRLRSLLARRDEELVRLLREDVEPVLDLFLPLPTTANLKEVLRVMEEYGLMPADATIAVTCLDNGIDVIATLDEDFRRIPRLKVIP